MTINDKIIASGYCNRSLGEDSIDYKIRVDKLRQLVQKETPAITPKPVVQSQDYNNGLKCEYLGTKVPDMTKTQLVEFIGQLVHFISKPKPEPDMSISVCTYKSGDFQIMIQTDAIDITFEGHRNTPITEEELNILNEIAPACVFTPYKRV